MERHYKTCWIFNSESADVIRSISFPPRVRTVSCHSISCKALPVYSLALWIRTQEVVMFARRFPWCGLSTSVWKWLTSLTDPKHAVDCLKPLYLLQSNVRLQCSAVGQDSGGCYVCRAVPMMWSVYLSVEMTHSINWPQPSRRLSLATLVWQPTIARGNSSL